MPWGGIFDIPQKTAVIEQKEIESQDPTFWDDPKKAEIHLREINKIKVWTETYAKIETMADDLEVLAEFKAMGEVEDAEVDAQYEKTLSRL